MTGGKIPQHRISLIERGVCPRPEEAELLSWIFGMPAGELFSQAVKAGVMIHETRRAPGRKDLGPVPAGGPGRNSGTPEATAGPAKAPFAGGTGG
jgi:hypothetical protein